MLSESERLELIARQIENIKGGIRSLTYFRLLSDKTNSDMHFWLSTKISHFEHFVLSFSKSFGSSNENLHWKSIIINNEEFKKRLLHNLDTDQHKFKKYMKSLLTLRNKVVAHTDIDLKTIKVPNFDIALAAFNYLYKELRSELLKFKEQLVVDNGPACIKMWESNLLEEAENYIQTAVDATKEVKEYH